MTLSRRQFLTRAALGIGGAAAASSGLTVWSHDHAGAAPRGAARAREAGRADRTLVVIELGGGNDALNTVVPIGAAAGRYHDLRPTLAIDDPLPLDADAGFHPELTRLARMYEADKVAIVEGIGYEPYDLSHFGSMAIWWSAAGEAGQAGWLGRYFDETSGFDDPLAGLSIGPSPSPAMSGQRSFSASIADATGLQPQVPAWAGSPDSLLDAWRKLAPGKVDATTLSNRVRGAIAATATAHRELDTRLDGPAGSPPTDDLDGGYGQAGAALDLAARLVVRRDAPRVVYLTGLGDYDTHQGQTVRHPALLADLDAGIGRFFDAIEAAGVADRVVLMTTSEFGRRPAENGDGTDHGTASTQFVIGAPVRGGRYGEPHDLDRLDRNGNLAVPVDFRVLYTTVLDGWLGVDPDAILGDSRRPLALFG